jgi:hypothetical protein
VKHNTSAVARPASRLTRRRPKSYTRNRTPPAAQNAGSRNDHLMEPISV